MYNRYIPGGFDLPPPDQQPLPLDQQPPTPEPEAPAFADLSAEETPAEPEKKSLVASIKSLFGNNIKLPDMNSDTVLLLVLVYFLVADDKENISDTLLVIGVLLLLGF